MVDGALEVISFAVNPDKYFVHVPAPLRKRLMMDASVPDLPGEHWTEPVPPEPHGLMTVIDATLEQQIFDLPQ